MNVKNTRSWFILKGEDDDTTVSSASECQELSVEYLEKAVEMLRYRRYEIDWNFTVRIVLTKLY